MRARLLTVAGVSLALAISGCGSSSGTGDAQPAPASAQPALFALSPAEQEAALSVSALAVEHELAKASGLATALGGDAKAFAALEALGAAWPRTTAPQTTFGRTGVSIHTDTNSLAHTLDYVNTTSGAELAGYIADPPNDGQPATASQTDSHGGFTSTTTRSTDTGTSVVDMTVTGTEQGVEGTSHVRAESLPCPDSSGTFTAKVTMGTIVAAQAGGAGWSTTTAITVTGHVDDDANLTDWNAEAGWEASTSGGGGAAQKATGTYGFTMAGATPSGEHASGTLDLAGTTQEFGRNWQSLTSLRTYQAGKKAVEAAQKAWQSGRCVRIDVTTDPNKRSGLQPSTTVEITAAPRSTIDGAPTGGSVTGQLSGPQSLAPNGQKVDADAKLTYTAADSDGKTGTISLEARSKRGVGKVTVDLSTGGAFTVSGTLGSTPETSFNGCIPKAGEPFSADFTGGNVGTITFTPTSDVAGSWTWKGKVGNAPMPEKGRGKYTISTTPDGTGTLALTGQVDTNRLVDHYTQTLSTSLTLTPTANC